MQKNNLTLTTKPLKYKLNCVITINFTGLLFDS